MLKIASLIIILVVVQAEGCAPGSGTLGSKAQFDFVMNPAILYTYCEQEGCTFVGQISADTANKTVKADVQTSINEVLQANSIPLNDVNPPTITYSAKNVIVAAAGTTACAKAGEAIPVDKTLYYLCTEIEGELKPEEFKVDLTVQITAISQIYQSQWNMLASQVADKVAAKHGANFYPDTVVTVYN
ncbi:hypothetical protein L5515_007239 [Caenorhabditis briggsae]|uniref:Uncharacterized protein n=1 Tax=Caenorhabditis briggsae TaxID=6238 RepID=A0AAE9JKX4_CAEBR|nr:hypothetical protein L5515_007239 [Caenorhabditis briggsae]